MGSILKPYQARPVGNRQRQYFKKRNFDKAPNVQHEQILQEQVCRYLKSELVGVMFRSDTSSGRWEYNKRELEKKWRLNSSKSWPDLMIYEPRVVDGVKYCGYALELKKAGTTIIVSRGPEKGHLTKDPHIREQYLLLKELKKRGWCVGFAVGYEDAIKKINKYFDKKTPQNGELF